MKHILKYISDFWDKLNFDPAGDLDQAGEVAKVGLQFLPAFGTFIIEHPIMAAIIIVTVTFILANIFNEIRNLFR